MNQPDTNLIHNGTFSQLDAGRPAGWEATVVADLQRDGEKSGIEVLQFAERGNAVKLRSAPIVATWFGLESDPIAVEPGTRLELSAAMKTQNVHRDVSESPLGPMAEKMGLHLPDEHPSRSNVDIAFFDDSGEIVEVYGSAYTGTEPVMGNQEWHRVSTAVSVPDGAATARVRCVMTLFGGACFTDIRLEA